MPKIDCHQVRPLKAFELKILNLRINICICISYSKRPRPTKHWVTKFLLSLAFHRKSILWFARRMENENGADGPRQMSAGRLELNASNWPISTRNFNYTHTNTHTQPFLWLVRSRKQHEFHLDILPFMFAAAWSGPKCHSFTLFSYENIQIYAIRRWVRVFVSVCVWICMFVRQARPLRIWDWMEFDDFHHLIRFHVKFNACVLIPFHDLWKI